MYNKPRASSRAMSEAWPPIGTTVPKEAASAGAAALVRAASAMEIRHPFQRIDRFSDLSDYRLAGTPESMIDMANNNRITKVSRVFPWA
jgi:hypothetical protein